MSERMYRCKKCKEYKAMQQLTECDDCIEKQHELEEKAAKWDMIQWALDNGICFVWNGESRRVWLAESDLIDLERQYKEREQDGR